MIRSNRAQRHAMTLIEMLVGIALLSIVMGGSYRMMHSASLSARERQQIMLSNRGAWRTINRLAHDLRSVPARPGIYHLRGSASRLALEEASEFGEKGLRDAFNSDTIPADSLRLTTLIPGPAPGQGVYGRVEYVLRPAGAEMRGGLYRRFAPLGEELEERAWELINGEAVGLELRYLDSAGEWRADWEADAAPLAVQIRIWMPASLRGREPRIEEFRSVVNLPAGKEIEL